MILCFSGMREFITKLICLDSLEMKQHRIYCMTQIDLVTWKKLCPTCEFTSKKDTMYIYRLIRTFSSYYN
jgi:hypothetical protein